MADRTMLVRFRLFVAHSASYDLGRRTDHRRDQGDYDEFLLHFRHLFPQEFGAGEFHGPDTSIILIFRHH